LVCKLQKICPLSTDSCIEIRRASECACYKAVMQAYKCIINDEPEHIALDAAQRVYRYHYPDDNKVLACLTVERWVNETRVH